MRTIKLRTVLLTAALSFASVTAADDLRLDSLFDSYSTGGSGSISTRGGTVFTGGSFTARFNQPNIQVMSWEPPSASAGCGGLDMTAGSFGFMSKDEIVQVGRAVAQGAAAYFFNMAIGSICPTCQEQIESIQNKIQRLNTFAKNACQNTQSLLAETWKSEDAAKNNADESSASQGNFLSARLGNVDSAMGWILNDTDKGDFGDAVNEEASQGSSVFDLVDELGPVSIGDFEYFSDIASGSTPKQKLTNFLMTLSGVDITNYDPSSENVEYIEIASGLDLHQFITAEDTLPKNYVKLSCANSECTNVAETDSSYSESVYKQVRSKLEDVYLKVKKGEDALDSSDANFIRLTDIHVASYIKLASKNNISDSLMIEWLANSSTKNYIESFCDALSKIVQDVSKSEKSGSGINLKQAFLNDSKKMVTSVDKAIDTLNERSKSDFQAIEAALSVANIEASTKDGGA